MNATATNRMYSLFCIIARFLSRLFFTKGLHCPALEPREDDVSHPHGGRPVMVRDVHVP